MPPPINRFSGFFDDFFKPSNGAVKMSDDRNQNANDGLSSLYDKLNESYEAAEKILKDMKMPLEARHEYRFVVDDDYDPQGQGTEFYLGFVKYDGKWQICHGTGRRYDTHDEGICWKPIRETAVEDRVRAASHLGKLKLALIDAKEKFIPKVDKAIQDIQGFLDEETGLF